MEGLSQIFDSVKGQHTDGRVTICEVHRRVYDRVVIALADQPEKLKPLVKDLEEAFILGVKMNRRLAQRRLESMDGFYPDAKDTGDRAKLRAERARLTREVVKQTEWLKKWSKNDDCMADR